jgi:hypothetical protein
MDGHQGKNQHRDTRLITFADSAARTTSSASVVEEIGDRGVLRLKVAVTATSGTPTLDITVKTRFDEDDSWRSTTLPQITTTGTVRTTVLIDREVQVDWTIAGGTPSLTFSIDGEAV